MKKYMTKKMIIEVLRKEPLSSGSFIYHEMDDYDSIKASKCEVCAAGAVVRKAFGSKASAWDVDDYCNTNIVNAHYQNLTIEPSLANYAGYGNTDYMIRQGLYLNALSNVFEGMMKNRREATPFVRKRLIAFVTKNFPDRIKL